MKANAPKRKVFQDALDLLAEDPVQDTSVAVNGIVSIPVEEIHPFHDVFLASDDFIDVTTLTQMDYMIMDSEEMR